MLHLSSASHVFCFEKYVSKIHSKFTGENPCRSAISLKLQRKFIAASLPHGCSPVNLLYIFRAPFYINTFDGLFVDKLAINKITFLNSQTLESIQWTCPTFKKSDSINLIVQKMSDFSLLNYYSFEQVFAPVSVSVLLTFKHIFCHRDNNN